MRIPGVLALTIACVFHGCASPQRKQVDEYVAVANISFAEPHAEIAVRKLLTERKIPFEIRYGSIADAVAVEKAYVTESISLLRELAVEKRFWIHF